ncbi:recombinase family protein [Kutzneria chonburiensis]|uniref:Recombinase family protein n=1 Tax=Kutzneria chonburiensis TaxID=1483604 RepID=A0ABV6N2R8_9PSEU|nr:recombinase family protein [Kutzneria chonburiensis]
MTQLITDAANPMLTRTAADVIWVAIYDRVSDDRRQDERSVKRQNVANRKAVDSHGWQVFDTYTDNSISASRFAKKERKDWGRLLADLEAGRVQVLMLWESSRGGRELERWARLLNTCRDLGVLIHITSRNKTYDVRNADDWRTLADDGVNSTSESDMISTRVRSGMLTAAEMGLPAGKAAYGLYREYHPRTKALLGQYASPDEAPIVHGIFVRFAKHISATMITKELNEAGVPAPQGGTWTPASVVQMAKRRIYIAERVYNGLVYEVDSPTLVSPELFWAVQRVLSDPKRQPHRKDKYIPGSAVHVMGNLAVCDVCDGRVRVNTMKRKRGPVRVYKCRKNHVSIDADGLDEFALAIVTDRLSRPDLFEAIATNPTDNKAIGQLRAKIRQLGQEITEAKQLAKDSKLSLADYAEISQAKREEVERLEAEARMASVPATLRGLLTPDDRLGDIAERLEELSLAGLREVIRTVAEIRVGQVGRGRKVPLTDPSRVIVRWRNAEPAAA